MGCLGYALHLTYCILKIASYTLYLTHCILHITTYTLHLTHCILHTASDTLHLTHSIFCIVSFILHLTLCIINIASHTLDFSCYMLHWDTLYGLFRLCIWYPAPLQVMVGLCAKFAMEKNLKFSTDQNPQKSKTKCIIYFKKLECVTVWLWIGCSKPEMLPSEKFLEFLIPHTDSW